MSLSKSLLPLAFALGLTLASCGSDSAGSDAGSGADAASDADAPAEGVEIVGAWARTSPMTVERGAIYFDIISATDDRLVAASVDASIAGSVEIHETVAVEDTDTDMTQDDAAEATMPETTMSETTMSDQSTVPDAAMMMRELPDGLELPAGQVVTLEPGGYHVMLIDLVEPLVTGETIELTLEFEKAVSKVVTVAVSEQAP